jgi:hypothetical protein
VFVPPLAPILVGLAFCVVVFHGALPALGVDLSDVLTSVIDVAVVVGVGVGGWFFRRSYRDSDLWRRLALWEATFGTYGIGVLIAVVGLVALAFAILQAPSWIGFALAVTAVGIGSAAVATTRKTSRPKTVVPEGEAPDDLDAYLRVSMPWSLDPGLPDVTGEVSLWVKKATVAEFREKNPVTKWEGSLPDFGWYVDNGNCQEVNDLADKLIAISRQRGLTTYLEVVLVLDLVQKIRYAHDDVTKGVPDYWSFALETIADQVGDCEDFAIMSVTLLSAMGHRTCFFNLPGHAALGVAGLTDDAGVWVEAADGERYYYVETTADGWKIGELPESYTRDQLRVAGLVAPLRARQPEPALSRVDSRRWSSETRAVWVGALGVALLGAVLGALVAIT